MDNPGVLGSLIIMDKTFYVMCLMLRHRHTNIHYNHYIKISGISSSSNTTDYIILDTLMGFF